MSAPGMGVLIDWVIAFIEIPPLFIGGQATEEEIIYAAVHQDGVSIEQFVDVILRQALPL
jgi:hypothetical protein